MSRVSIIQEHLHDYRAAFFDSLHSRLREHGVELSLYYDFASTPSHLLDDRTWSHHCPTRRLGKLTWQQLPKFALDTDLMIVPQQMRYPANLWRILTRRFHSQKIAFWGHGHCFAQGWEHRNSEKLKAWLSKQVDWWFAYNQRSMNVVSRLGFPTSRITRVQNSVDTVALRRSLESVTESETAALREQLGISSENVCVYTGNFNTNKHLQFLLEAAQLIRASVPDFELLMIGGGPDEARVIQAARDHSWIHHLGRLEGVRKIPYWAISKLLLMPGLVGLVIIDSFAAGLPLVTTDFPNHSHEIDYLRHGTNGWMVDDWQHPAAYAAAVVGLLNDNPLRESLRRGAWKSGNEYSLDAMIANFADGILHALKTP